MYGYNNMNAAIESFNRSSYGAPTKARMLKKMRENLKVNDFGNFSVKFKKLRPNERRRVSNHLNTLYTQRGILRL